MIEAGKPDCKLRSVTESTWNAAKAKGLSDDLARQEVQNAIGEATRKEVARINAQHGEHTIFSRLS